MEEKKYICPIVVTGEDKEIRINSSDIDQSMLEPYMYHQLDSIYTFTDAKIANLGNRQTKQLYGKYNAGKIDIIDNYITSNIINVVLINFTQYIETICKELYGDSYEEKMQFYMTKIFDIPTFDSIRECISGYMMDSFYTADRYEFNFEDRSLKHCMNLDVYSRYLFNNLLLASDAVLANIVNTVFERYIASHMSNCIQMGALGDFYKTISDAAGIEDIDCDNDSFKHAYCSAYLREKYSAAIYNIKASLFVICNNAVRMYLEDSIDITNPVKYHGTDKGNDKIKYIEVRPNPITKAMDEMGGLEIKM